MNGQPVANILFNLCLFEIGGDELKGTVFLSKISLDIFVNGSDKCLFSQVTTMVPIEPLFENNGEEKGNGLISFHQKKKLER